MARYKDTCKHAKQMSHMNASTDKVSVDFATCNPVLWLVFVYFDFEKVALSLHS